VSFYSELAATAAEIIAEFGGDATLRRKVPGVYDPATGLTTIVSTDQVVRCVVIDYPQRFVDGTLIRVGDKQVYVGTAAGGMTPKVGDSLLSGGVEYQVVNFKPLAPALVAVLWELQVRSA
jgi:hypothetical protein